MVTRDVHAVAGPVPATAVFAPMFPDTLMSCVTLFSTRLMLFAFAARSRRGR